MKRLVVLAAFLVFMGALVFAASSISVSYGDYVSRSYELNDNEIVTFTVTNVPAHVHVLYISLDPSLDGKVFCAPGRVSHEANEVWDGTFTCILLKGTYEGMIYVKPDQIDVDASGPLAEAKTTRVSLSVTEKEVWYTNYAYTSVGGQISAGPYIIKVNDSDVVSADIEVLKGSVPVFTGVVFIGQEVKVADDFYLAFNGYSEKRGMAFFTIRTKFPVAVASSTAEYYLVASPVYYVGDENKARVDIYTNCPKVSLCDQNDECKDFSVSDSHEVSMILSPGDYEVKCYGADLEVSFSVKEPPVKVVEKKVEVKQDPNEICPSWFYGLPD